MNKKCILFDSDGVIVHTEMYSKEYQRQSSISNDEMLPFYLGVFQECLAGKADLKEVIRPWLVKWKWYGTADEFLNNWFQYENKPDQRVIDLIKNLRKQGIICCLATNQEQYRTSFMKNEMGFADLFNHIYSSAEINYKKPDKEFYEYIFREMNQKYGFSKEDLFYVDDTVSHVEGGNNAGIDSFHFTNFDDFQKHLFSFVEGGGSD